MLLNMRAYEIIFVVICLLLQVSVPDAFVVADMSYFPDIMITTRAIADQTALAIDALRQASVPMTLDSALSIGISEVFAGVTAGAITRRTADLLGDKKKDTFRTKVSTTGAFFGARGLARGLARAVGLPKPLALLCGSVAGSLVSEGTKIFGRTESEQNDRKLKKTTIFEDSGLKASEITGDIVKWLVYDGLEDKVVISHADDFVQLVLTTFVVGSIAAISGTMIKDFGRGVEKEIEKSKNKKIRESNQKKKLEKKKISITPKKVGSKVSTNFIPKEIDNNPFIRSVLTRYATAAIEGGVLFASYQITTKMVKSVVPENYNVKFVFNQVLQEIEREIDPDIV